MQGRSGWVVRKTPLHIGGKSIAAYKLKGIGVMIDRKAMPPQMVSHHMSMGKNTRGILIHMGFHDDGRLRAVADTQKPTGGNIAGRGQKEYNNTLKISEIGSGIPIAWGKNKTLQWKDQALEYVILGYENPSPYRVSEFFETRNKKMNPLLVNHVKERFDDNRSFEEKGFHSLYEILQAYGALLHGFHNHGLVRFAGHLGNVSYHGEKGILHDLDSSLLLTELAPNIRGLSRMRDLESALFGITHSYQHSGFYTLFPKVIQNRWNLYEGFLRGYFGPSELTENQGALFLNHMQTEFIASANAQTIEEHCRWFEHLETIFCPLSFTLLYQLFTESDAGIETPLLYGPEVFEKHYTQFRQERSHMIDQFRLMYS